MYRKHFSRNDLPDEIVRQREKAMANMYFTSGGYYLKGGDRKSARRMVLRAIGACPRILIDPRMLHKIFYCLFGGYPAYAGARNVYRRTAGTEHG
jgi:hypothetical protein